MRENQLTLLVLLALNVDLYLVARLQIRVITELCCRNDTIALVADVDDYLFLVDGDNCSLDNLVLLNLLQSLVVGLLLVFFAGFNFTAILELVPVEIG